MRLLSQQGIVAAGYADAVRQGLPAQLYRQEPTPQPAVTAPQQAHEPAPATAPTEVIDYEHKRNNRTAVILGSLVGALLITIVVALIIVMGGAGKPLLTAVSPSGGATSAKPSQQESTSPSPSSTASAASLDRLGQTGCSAVSTDANLLVTFAKANSDDVKWRDLDSEGQVEQGIASLKQACGEEYVKQVAEKAKAGGATKSLATTLDRLMIADVKPIPNGALQLDRINSPSKNIDCVLYEDSVFCSLATQNYASAGIPDCGSMMFNIYVDGNSQVGICNLGDPPSTTPTELAYGQSATNGGVACTSESTGMTCWVAKTGHGFTVSKQGYTKF